MISRSLLKMLWHPNTPTPSQIIHFPLLITGIKLRFIQTHVTLLQKKYEIMPASPMCITWGFTNMYSCLSSLIYCPSDSVKIGRRINCLPAIAVVPETQTEYCDTWLVWTPFFRTSAVNIIRQRPRTINLVLPKQVLFGRRRQSSSETYINGSLKISDDIWCSRNAFFIFLFFFIFIFITTLLRPIIVCLFVF